MVVYTWKAKSGSLHLKGRLEGANRGWGGAQLQISNLRAVIWREG
jgi:hypothetical protein